MSQLSNQRLQAGSVPILQNQLVKSQVALVPPGLHQLSEWTYRLPMCARASLDRGILQVKGPQSCPLAILNGLLDILVTLASTTSPFLTNSKNFAAIQKHLQDLIPTESRRMRRLMVVNEAYRMKPAIYEDEEGNEYEDFSAFVEHNVDEDKMAKLGIKRRLEAVSFSQHTTFVYSTVVLAGAR